MLGHTLHHVSSHYTAGWRKRSEKAWENGRKRRKNKGRERKGKRREQAGKTRAWRYALPNGRKGKTVIMQSWERAAFVPLDVSFCDRKRNSVYGNNRMA